jgi:hypothetical protein
MTLSELFGELGEKAEVPGVWIGRDEVQRSWEQHIQREFSGYQSLKRKSKGKLVNDKE